MPLKLYPPREGRTPYWSVRGTHLGVHLNRSTGFGQRAQAARQLRAWTADIEAGRFERPGERTFLDAIVSYVQAGGDRLYLGRFDEATGTLTGIAGELGPLPISAVDQAAIDAAAFKLYPHATAATRNRQLYTPVSAVLKFAGADFKIRRPKGWRGQRRTDWLTPDQAWRFLAAAETVDADFARFLAVLLYTGLRLSEALGLTWDRIELEEAAAFIPGNQTKNGDPRTVFLPEPAIRALGELAPRKRPLQVWRWNKGGRLYNLMKATRIAAGDDLAWVNFHSFRHTWATWMRRYGGLDTTGLVATGAWRDRTSAARYEHTTVAEESRRAALLPVPSPRSTAFQKSRKEPQFRSGL